MKNIQVIDGAQNGTNEIYAISDKLFSLIFPKGTDVAFIADLERKFGELDRRFKVLYKRPLDKKSIRGIHGTLILDMSCRDPKFFPTRREAEVICRAPFPK
jgi:hypothetical protein